MGNTISGTLPDGVSTSQTYRGTLFVQQTILSAGSRWSGFQIAVFGAVNATYIRLTDPGADNTWYNWLRMDNFGCSTLSGLASALGGSGPLGNIDYQIIPSTGGEYTLKAKYGLLMISTAYDGATALFAIYDGNSRRFDGGGNMSSITVSKDSNNYTKIVAASQCRIWFVA